MRIGYLVSKYPAPSHTFIRREVEALERLGADIAMFSIRRPEDVEVLSDDDRQSVSRTTYVLPASVVSLALDHVGALLRSPLRYLRALRTAWGHRLPGVRNALWSVFYFVEAISLAGKLRAQGVEHLHNHFANASANVGLIATRFLDIGWSLTLHGTADFDYPPGALLGGKLLAADFGACVSHFGRAQAMRTLPPAQWDKLFVSRCGLHMASVPEVTPRADAGPVQIICVGRLSPEKAHTGLLEAFSQLRRGGLDAELTLIGDGPSRALIESEVAARELGDVVHLRGRVAEAETLEAVSTADILVLTSLMEGVPVVLMEAMAMRVAVVAPRLSGIPELVEDGTHGLLFRPADWSDLADCLGRLAGDPQLRLRMGAAGRERILESFDVDVAVKPLWARLQGQDGRSTSGE